jgi:hypothetical protein
MSQEVVDLAVDTIGHISRVAVQVADNGAGTL